MLALLPLLPLLAGAAIQEPGDQAHIDQEPGDQAHIHQEPGDQAHIHQEPGDQAPGIPAPGLHFPPGPAAAVWANVQADTPARLPDGAARIPAHAGDAAWATPAPWQRWAALVGAEAQAVRNGDEPDAARRAALALFALGQGRGRDAWAHFTACHEPALLAGLAPRFMPGAPASTSGANATTTAPTWRSALPDGVLLRPALPPPTPGVIEGRVDRRGYTLEGFRVGDAVLSLTVTQEPDGIQVDVEHRSGGAASLQLVIPAPPFLDVRVEYLDWERQETIGAPLTLAVQPGDERHTLWARFRPRDNAWPGAPVPGSLPRQLTEHGLQLMALEGDPETPRLTAAADALASLFPAPVGLLLVDEGSPRPTGPATIIDLREGPDRARRLAALFSMAERELLAAP